MTLGGLRVLVTHEWLYTWAGAERCLEQILAIFPQADLLVGIITNGARRHHAIAMNARETWVGRVPGARAHHRCFLPLHALAFASYDTRQYDLVISSSHAFEKFVKPRAGAVHVCYCYSPPRYLWDLQTAYEDQTGVLAGGLLRLTAPVLRRLDRRAASGVDRFVSISRHVAERVQRAYGRSSDVVYPPVQLKRTTSASSLTRSHEPFLLFVGRLVPYKRVDLAVLAAKRLGVRLVVAGDGPERARLERLADSSTEFTGEIGEDQAAQLLDRCTAFVFPAEEDFGIAPLEANAHGRPVICYARGGVLETMTSGTTAEFFHEQSVTALCAAIERCLSRSWDREALRANAARFTPDRFRTSFVRVVETALATHGVGR